MRDDRCRRVAGIGIKHDLDAVGSEHFDGADQGGFGQGMGVDSEEQRSIDPLRFAVLGNGLADGQDMGFVEAVQLRTATMPGGTKGHAMGGFLRVR